MAYSAIEKMRKKNEQIYGKDVGPMQPELSIGAEAGFDLKSAALRFLHERCEGLFFDRQIEEEEERTGLYHGTGLAPGQIPYNMQMDINRLCLERELEKFMDSAATQDAYTVFYCFLEIFFGNYEKYKKRVELLSEYESNGSSLLMKHRDQASAEAAHFFLKYWGMTSLFHDIGYPFELTFEQILRLAPLEHERWLREHQSMGWKNGDLYEHVPLPLDADEKSYRAAQREQTRCHKLVVDGELTKERIISHYQEHLSEYEKQKNFQLFNNMLKLMRKFDGVRIYQYYT